jgi:hypothetical protein
MKVLAIFGTIEFLHDDENTALVHSVDSADFLSEDAVERRADQLGLDYLMPNHYNGRITFMQYHTEK